MLRNQVIGQMKVQWKHLGPYQATCELKDAMWEAYPFLVNFVDSKDDVVLMGSGM